METCIYRGEPICAFDVSPNDILDWEKKKEWRKAAELNQLRCEECDQPVELRAGEIVIPYFAHKRVVLDLCPYSKEFKKETEEHRKARFLLYQYLKDKYPGFIVVPNKRFDGSRRADIYIRLSDSREMVFEFQRIKKQITGERPGLLSNLTEPFLLM